MLLYAAASFIGVIEFFCFVANTFHYWFVKTLSGFPSYIPVKNVFTIAGMSHIIKSY